MDTGASISLLRKDVWDHATTLPPGVTLQPWSGQTLESAKRSPLTVHGHATVPVRLGTCMFFARFTVAVDMTTEAILGLDFLESNQCTMDMQHRSLTFPDGTSL